MGEQPSTHQPVTYDRCAHIEGPFYHGTKSALGAGAELVPGYGSNFQQSRVSNNIYFTALVDTAAWGAELATALAGSGARGHIYVVEPIGPFEDDLARSCRIVWTRLPDLHVSDGAWVCW